MPHTFLRCSLVALGMFTMLLFPTTVPIAHAQKDEFVRSKPHVNVGSVRSGYRGNDRLRSAGPSNNSTTKTFIGRNDGHVQQIQSSPAAKKGYRAPDR
jgi:hypothetical protein